jgi:hypothetical protein
MDTERHHLKENRKPQRLGEEEGYIYISRRVPGTQRKKASDAGRRPVWWLTEMYRT